ncbi:ogr/Delta-like zinc finger family protein [Morganella morganii]|uniref:ogr/Delta-like zinc finger family protein n=1 Tax=Morganella morganii TaxID=582 RepID=UPI001644B48A|nr:ogr/Delta-like zinc finger family protein [Morganella morganii]MBC3959674.1 ogr/Delta-like zinc finger family protein [Morganella morganii]HAT1528272.1 transcriptional regulator [Morganella morganii]HBH7053340.1 ogr/Delta-like zinc finger family protein [Morganella morganii]HDF2366322.1 ogr/Delta-like zinc finger family protein [Morganella morganii]HDF2424526.1 ogr/Delta-like zinc finger family protein [Morganella morganii]
MMKCPLCGELARTRSSRDVTTETKERYNQCMNINCGATFVSLESLSRFITKPQLIGAVTLHPTNDKQLSMGL